MQSVLQTQFVVSGSAEPCDSWTVMRVCSRKFVRAHGVVGAHGGLSALGHAQSCNGDDDADDDDDDADHDDHV